jgi:hypothetical protein
MGARAGRRAADACGAVVNPAARIAVLCLMAALALTLWGLVLTQPIPNCEIVNGREIDTHHCIPYCPPDPKECD